MDFTNLEGFYPIVPFSCFYVYYCIIFSLFLQLCKLFKYAIRQ